MPQFVTALTTLIASLVTRVTTLATLPQSPAPAPGETPRARRLGETLTTLLHERLAQIKAALTTLLTTPFLPPKRAPKPPALRFLPVSRTLPPRDPDAPPPVKPERLPTSYRWLTKLFPEFLPDRHALEDRLREDDVKAALAADPRLAREVRKLAWMLGVQRNLIPPAPPRGQVFLVVDSNVAQARHDYREARKVLSEEEIFRRWCAFPDHPWQVRMRELATDKRHNHDKRPLWLGPRLKLPEIMPYHPPFRG